MPYCPNIHGRGEGGGGRGEGGRYSGGIKSQKSVVGLLEGWWKIKYRLFVIYIFLVKWHLPQKDSGTAVNGGASGFRLVQVAFIRLHFGMFLGPF